MKKAITRQAETVILGVIIMLVVINMVHHISHDYCLTNLHLIQAHPLANGHLDISIKASDVAIYNNKYYVVFPPLPALLLVPLVSILGAESVKVTMVSLVLTLINIFVFYRILLFMKIAKSIIPWILVAFFLGTAYWYCLTMSMWIWFYAQIVGSTFCLLAVHESLVRGRGLTAGLCLGLAFLSRQMLIYSVFFVIVALWEHTPDIRTGRKVRNLVSFMVPLGVCIGFYLFLNWFRFGDLFDTGYSYLQLSGVQKARLDRYGLFHPVYLSFNFMYMFLQGFHIEFSPPDYVRVLRLDPFGTSLLAASPFVFLAVLARWNRRLLMAAWLTIGISLVHLMFYFINGHIQLNAQRYTLDFIPILMLLVARGLDEARPVLWKILIVYAVLLNIIAIVIIGFK